MDDSMCPADRPPPGCGVSGLVENTGVKADRIITMYLLERSEEFRSLSIIRRKGWDSPAGDAYFQRQRHTADHCDHRTALMFYELMKKIGQELQRSANAFIIEQNLFNSPAILDLCMAPGGFLECAMRFNPNAVALAFSLPRSAGGHEVLLPNDFRIDKRFMDITMLAADLNEGNIPPDHPDASSFLPRQIPQRKVFELVLCDGQVLRTHERKSYREKREARRLTTTQLILGLEHLRAGGTMIVLLHKLEVWETFRLLWQFHVFSDVKLVKPRAGHAKRSSFYMIARNVQSGHPLALQAIRGWKTAWRTSTFGSEEDQVDLLWSGQEEVHQMLENFGSTLIEWGREIWKIQTKALTQAPFMQAS